MQNALNWFDIPTTNLDRAVRFYETMLDKKLRRENFGGLDIAIFPGIEPGARGSLVANPRMKPSAQGSVVYLNVNGALDAAVARVQKAGGDVILPKTAIGDAGHMALVKDTEGNIVGLHSS